MGIIYKPKGWAIVKHDHYKLKIALKMFPYQIYNSWQIYLAGETINFLNPTKNGTAEAVKQFNQVKEKQVVMVLGKEHHTRQRKRPSTVLNWPWKCACVFSENAEWPILVPEYDAWLSHKPRYGGVDVTF